MQNKSKVMHWQSPRLLQDRQNQTNKKGFALTERAKISVVSQKPIKSGSQVQLKGKTSKVSNRKSGLKAKSPVTSTIDAKSNESKGRKYSVNSLSHRRSKSTNLTSRVV